jgi:hypothetical protein
LRLFPVQDGLSDGNATKFIASASGAKIGIQQVSAANALRGFMLRIDALFVGTFLELFRASD